MDRRNQLLSGSTALKRPEETIIQAIEPPSIILTETEAAPCIRLSARSLQRLRLDGGGPRFVQLMRRRIGYRLQDLEAWCAARVVSSTSERL